MNQYFETDFPKYYLTIKLALSTEPEIGEIHPNSEEIINAVEKIIALGSIGRLRHPEDMRHTEQVIFGTLLDVLKDSPEQSHGLKAYLQQRSEFSNKIPLDYKELSKDIHRLMGEITYSIFTAPDNEYFLLPDCTSAIQRFQLEEDSIIEGETFINPARAIGLILMPINSKTLLAAVSTKVLPGNGHGTYPLSKEFVQEYNKILFNSAFNEVACENKIYLEEFVNRNQVDS